MHLESEMFLDSLRLYVCHHDFQQNAYNNKLTMTCRDLDFCLVDVVVFVNVKRLKKIAQAHTESSSNRSHARTHTHTHTHKLM